MFFENSISAQKLENALQSGEIHGNIQYDFQTYNRDSLIGAPIVPEKARSQGFANLNYVNKNFSAGLRYESYEPQLLGFDPRYRGSGITYRYARYQTEQLDITFGNFYEQFGSGLIFRTYEERNLGYDNAMDGFRLKAKPLKGVYLKGFVGQQRLFFTKAKGILRGIDGEVVINELFDSLNIAPRITLGGSFLTKYEQSLDPNLNLPENVGSWAGRATINWGKWNFMAEYTYKMNDPYPNLIVPIYNNNFRHGEAFYLTLGYSQKNFGFNIEAKRVDNMLMRSERNEAGVNALVNFIPALTKVHTYNLAATLYPYAVQPNGEMGIQADVIYTFPKNTLLGGKYGTTITANFAQINNIDTVHVQDQLGKRQLYKSDFFSVGKDVFFRDINFEIQKKISSKAKLNIAYYNFLYNMEVIQGLIGKGTIYANIGVVDFAYKIKSNLTLRAEAQMLHTKQDMGDWYTGVIEVTTSKFFFAILDQYNAGNPDPVKQIHYITGSVGYVKEATRVTLSYGRQRAGIFCVGGVCRNVPASNGFSMSVTHTF